MAQCIFLIAFTKFLPGLLVFFIAFTKFLHNLFDPLHCIFRVFTLFIGYFFLHLQEFCMVYWVLFIALTKFLNGDKAFTWLFGSSKLLSLSFYHRNNRHRMRAPIFCQSNKWHHCRNSKCRIYKGKWTRPRIFGCL